MNSLFINETALHTRRLHPPPLTLLPAPRCLSGPRSDSICRGIHYGSLSHRQRYEALTVEFCVPSGHIPFFGKGPPFPDVPSLPPFAGCHRERRQLWLDLKNCPGNLLQCRVLGLCRCAVWAGNLHFKRLPADPPMGSQPPGGAWRGCPHHIS